MKLYIGMDVHKKFSLAVVMNGKGKVVHEEKLFHGTSIAQVPWESFFKQFKDKPHLAIEATGVSYPILEAVEPFCATVAMAHPLKTKLIAEQKIKTDAIDGRTLAHLRRTDFLPTAYIPPREIRDRRELLRHRMGLVQIQTSIKNKIHAVLTRQGEFYLGTDLFGKQGKQYLANLDMREPYREQLDRYLRLLVTIGEEIKEVTREIGKRIELDPKARLLTTIPGIGKILAAVIFWEIGDINRFAHPGKLASFCGLVPRVHSSGGKTWHGSITKEGNKFMRWALVEATQGYGNRQGPLGERYRRIAKKGGSKKARVAMAAKLVNVIWHMLMKGEEFDESKLGMSKGSFWMKQL